MDGRYFAAPMQPRNDSIALQIPTRGFPWFQTVPNGFRPSIVSIYHPGLLYPSVPTGNPKQTEGRDLARIDVEPGVGCCKEQPKGEENPRVACWDFGCFWIGGPCTGWFEGKPTLRESHLLGFPYVDATTGPAKRDMFRLRFIFSLLQNVKSIGRP